MQCYNAMRDPRDKIGVLQSVRTSTGATPFSLVYGIEVVLPVEVEIPSMRVLMEAKLGEAE